MGGCGTESKRSLVRGRCTCTGEKNAHARKLEEVGRKLPNCVASCPGPTTAERFSGRRICATHNWAARLSPYPVRKERNEGTRDADFVKRLSSALRKSRAVLHDVYTVPLLTPHRGQSGSPSVPKRDCQKRGVLAYPVRSLFTSVCHFRDHWRRLLEDQRMRRAFEPGSQITPDVLEIASSVCIFLFPPSVQRRSVLKRFQVWRWSCSSLLGRCCLKLALANPFRRRLWGLQ